MYERFYGFDERPFSLLPDPDFLYPGTGHQSAMDLLQVAILNRSGFCVISGEIGAGKTTLVRQLLNQVDDSIRVGLVSNTHASFGELLQWILAAFGLPCAHTDKMELHRQFIDFVIQQYAQNRRTLLIIDEAQNLTTEALEELRMLSNVNSDKDFVLQIILVGQPQLREHLKNPRLEQFAQRIALDYHLDYLNEQETGHYIRHRLLRAGGNPDIFSAYAAHAVYQRTDGNPRLINRLCDLCLVYGYSEESLMIDAELVHRVADDQEMGALSCERYKVPAAAPPSTVSAVLREDAVRHGAQSAGSEESPNARQAEEFHRLIIESEQNERISVNRHRYRRLGFALSLIAVLTAGGWFSKDLWLQHAQAVMHQATLKVQAVAPGVWAKGAVPARPVDSRDRAERHGYKPERLIP